MSEKCISVAELKKRGMYPLPYDDELSLADNIRRDLICAGKPKSITISPRTFQEINKSKDVIFHDDELESLVILDTIVEIKDIAERYIINE